MVFSLVSVTMPPPSVLDFKPLAFLVPKLGLALWTLSILALSASHRVSLVSNQVRPVTPSRSVPTAAQGVGLACPGRGRRSAPAPTPPAIQRREYPVAGWAIAFLLFPIAAGLILAVAKRVWSR